MRLSRRHNAEAPHAQVFRTRFGSKRDQIAALSSFVRAVPEFAEVARICAESPAVEGAVATRPERHVVVTGAVYLLRMGEFYKIGKSNDPGRRIYELGVRLPEKHEVVHVIDTDDPSGIGSYWHRRFASQRANGEWFRLSDLDVEAFERRTYM